MDARHETILIDAGVAMTRAARIDNGKVKQVWFGPALGDEARYAMPIPGERYSAKVLRGDKTLKADFLDLGLGEQAMMRHGTDHALHEGQYCEVEVTQARRGRKLPTVKFISELSTDQNPGAVVPGRSALETACDMLGHDMVAKILVSSGAAKAHLQNYIELADIDIRHSEFCFESIEEKDILDTIFHPHVNLPSGGIITLEEAEALTAIDIDSASMGAPSRNRLNEKLNREAAFAMIDHVRLRRIGGQVVVDFLPMPKPVFHKFDNWLKKLCRDLPGFGRAGWTPSGLFSFTVPRHMPSMLDQYTVPETQNIVPGRKFTSDFLLRWSLCHAEAKLKAHPTVHLAIKLGSQLQKHWVHNPQWQERLDNTYGGRIRVDLSADLEPDGSILDEKL